MIKKNRLIACELAAFAAKYASENYKHLLAVALDNANGLATDNELARAYRTARAPGYTWPDTRNWDSIIASMITGDANLAIEHAANPFGASVDGALWYTRRMQATLDPWGNK